MTIASGPPGALRFDHVAEGSLANYRKAPACTRTTVCTLRGYCGKETEVGGSSASISCNKAPQAAAQATGWVSPQLDTMNYYEQSSTDNEDVEDDPRQSISDHLDSDPESQLPYSDAEVEDEQPDGKLLSTMLATVSSMLLQHNEDTLRILKLPRQRLKSSSSASKRWRKIRRSKQKLGSFRPRSRRLLVLYPAFRSGCKMRSMNAPVNVWS